MVRACVARYMEDMLVCVGSINPICCAPPSTLDKSVERSYFAVFDGHGGTGAAAFCQKHLHRLIAKQLALGADPASAVVDAIAAVEQEFSFHARQSRDASGTCLVLALRVGRQLFVANVGDCRAALCCASSSPCVVPITSDHKPEKPSERARVKSCGGTVRQKLVEQVSRRRGGGARILASLVRPGPCHACWRSARRGAAKGLR